MRLKHMFVLWNCAVELVFFTPGQHKNREECCELIKPEQRRWHVDCLFVYTEYLSPLTLLCLLQTVSVSSSLESVIPAS